MNKKYSSQSADSVIGVISDTHGMFRPEVAGAFKNVDAIIHAGDIGSMAIIDELKEIAPVYAVRGNMDSGQWCENIPFIDVIDINHFLIYALHNIDYIDLNPKAAGFQAVIFGHTHQPQKFIKDGILFLNPGSAGPQRNRFPPSVARITVIENELSPEFIEL